MITLKDYTEACAYPGRLDETAVESALVEYFNALGVKRDVVRLRRGWRLDDHPALRTAIDGVIDDFLRRRDAQAARAALDALAAQAARAARDALDARAARAAWDALDARAARAAWAARDARAARAAQAARAALDARDALKKFGGWCLARSSWLNSWDLSWLSTTAFGARETKQSTVSKWAEPLLSAYESGCWFLFWTDDILYWVAKPRVHVDGQRRLHKEDGPAVESDAEDLYFWRGVLIPQEWIEDRAALTAATALTCGNIEQRRAACEIVGWHNILNELKATTIDRHADPQVGTLVEVNIPDVGRERFLRVQCGTMREFALPVPPKMKTAIEAQAWTWGLDPKEFAKPEVRT